MNPLSLRLAILGVATELIVSAYLLMPYLADVYCNPKTVFDVAPVIGPDGLELNKYFVTLNDGTHVWTSTKLKKDTYVCTGKENK